MRMHDLQSDASLESEIGGDIDSGHASTRDPGPHTVSTVDKPPDEGVGLLIGRHVKILWRTA
jgi:hypothetical protein